MTAYMRANDAVIGLLGDVFAFTFIQEFAARLLGVEVGTYTHHVGSMHLNLNHRAKVDTILAEPPGPRFAPLPMPRTDWETLAGVASWEQRLRANDGAFTARDGQDLQPYWRQIVALFEVHRQILHDGTVTDETLDLLRPGHRWLVQQRFPSRSSSAGVR
jgi:thymidylate synthase